MITREQEKFINYVVNCDMSVLAACRLLRMRVTAFVEWMNTDKEFVLEWLANCCLKDIRNAIKTGKCKKARYAGAAASRLRRYIEVNR